MSIPELKRMAGAAERLDSHLGRIRTTESSIMAVARRISGEPTRYGSVQTASYRPRDLVFERLIGPTDDILSIEFLEQGLLAKRAVGRIWNGADDYATGFHVGLGIVMTAAHALPSDVTASDRVFQLDAEEHTLGPSSKIRDYAFVPQRFFYVNNEYDLALCAVEDFTGTAPDINSFGWHVLSQKDEVIDPGHPVSVIHHPDGRAKSVTVHNSHFIQVSETKKLERFCWYTGDTERGSSGAPVFDPRWQVVALHHSGVPARSLDGFILGSNGSPVLVRGQPTKVISDLIDLDGVAFEANEGIRASRIARHLSGVEMANQQSQSLLEKLLALWSQPGAQRIAQSAAESGARIA
ncbi:serine protease [Yoonia sp. I 8.24]|uniref:trypsin-like serine peptidase n=1 Tax=Yoonia sp. I 8.24 TaxID=1537229 RepID=UPI001EDE0A73|nr:serine protease [Yoonia sp. I 8.24]MCG3266696.1 trypsin-like peptidase domain-containing protein [Yoonia sp. I 8.24]